MTASFPSEYVLLPAFVLALILAAKGVIEEVIWIPFGRIPSSPSGVLALVMLVAIGCHFSGWAMRSAQHLRPSFFPAPMHHGSKMLSIALAAVAGGAAWSSRTAEGSWMDAAIVVIVVMVLTYLIVGHPWSKFAEAKWIENNALIVQQTFYVVEGSNDKKTWVRVGRVSPHGLKEAKATAHETFKQVRCWTVEANMSLTESIRGNQITVGEPLPASSVTKEEAQAALCD